MTVTLAKHVVIVGAGPGGLLSAINFVNRGWKVTLVEKDSDLSSVAVSSKKSWAIGLNRIGEDALNRVPGLLEHVKPAAIKLQKAIMVMFGRKVEDEMENQVVDRNYMVQLLTEYLFRLSSSVGDKFDVKFSTNIIYVDGKRQIVRYEKDGELGSIHYDLLVGADGARSMVRNSLFTKLPEFEGQQGSIFMFIKSIFMQAPEGFANDVMLGIPGGIKGMMIMFMPGPEGSMNVLFTTNDNSVVDEEIWRNDPDQLCVYLNKHIKHAVRNVKELRNLEFSIKDCKQFTSSYWYRPQQVLCRPYHVPVSLGSAILLGDAAHATSPSMGMGMNMALEDAKVLDELLDLHREDLVQVLPAYSEARMKIGHALTELSFNTIPVTFGALVGNQLKSMMWSALHRSSFGLAEKGIFELIREAAPLDKVWEVAKKQGIYDSSKRTNDREICSMRECELGLKKPTKSIQAAMMKNRAMKSRDISELKKFGVNTPQMTEPGEFFDKREETQ
ncbi:hypothetical protein MP638_004129 [Amoeboaphelidium occidentale]|nr:hypothetical protein MP638_004129 [Amoeboaphelidium occidentale]